MADAEEFRAYEIEQLPQQLDPYDVMPFFADQQHVVLLDGPPEQTPLSRYSFLCIDPHLVFRSKRSQAFVGPPGEVVAVEGKPIEVLRRLLTSYKPASKRPADAPPFLSGICGYLSYEFLYEIEDIPDLGDDDLSVPDTYLFLCRGLVTTDKQEKKTWVVGTGFGSSANAATAAAKQQLALTLERVGRFQERRAEKNEAQRENLQQARREVFIQRPRFLEAHLAPAGITPVVSREHYLDTVRKAREHIYAGDVFEICISQRFDTTLDREGLDLYRILRRVNESPFSSYLRFPGMEVLSSSPERFMKLDLDRWAETRPIKGTRPRGLTPEQDRAMYDDLASCEKDAAENIMIVDLARNDLGRVCEFNTLEVPQLLAIESYPFTHQMVSTVRGRLCEGLDTVDLLRASFPGGSMTGAPKIEAMKIIDRLEPVKRGVFAGGIGYFDFDGSFDLSIVIRTMIKLGNKLSIHVGGAIVSDSEPEDEYQETLDKAHALVTALELCRRGI